MNPYRAGRFASFCRNRPYRALIFIGTLLLGMSGAEASIFCAARGVQVVEGNSGKLTIPCFNLSDPFKTIIPTDILITDWILPSGEDDIAIRSGTPYFDWGNNPTPGQLGPNYTSLDIIIPFTTPTADGPGDNDHDNATTIVKGLFVFSYKDQANADAAPFFGTIVVADDAPEPSTWAMMAIGFCAIGMVHRSHRRSDLVRVA